ncbi:hypothetical protein [Nocardia brevicatena]|uniref:hypothetical protein n=1 Tax=Nocardia brevicatena TaxID=37327 RepID=UPI0002DFD025|nr:hypothetical protein [Nocardia brevicatena]
MDRIEGWWDGFELWVAGLPFIPQFLVVLAGMVPISFAIAYLLDRGLKNVMRWPGREEDPGVRARDRVTAESGKPEWDVEPVPAVMVAPAREHVGSGAH